MTDCDLVAGDSNGWWLMTMLLLLLLLLLMMMMMMMMMMIVMMPNDVDDGFDDDVDLDVVVDGLTRFVLVQCLVLVLNSNAMMTMALALVFPRNLAGSPINRTSYSTVSFYAITSGNHLLCEIQFRGEDGIWMYLVYPIPDDVNSRHSLYFFLYVQMCSLFLRCGWDFFFPVGAPRS